MEKLAIQLDGSEIVKGVNDAVTALAELKAVIKSFVDASPKGQLQAQLQAVATSAVAVVDASEKAFSKISVSLAKGMQQAEATAKSSGKKLAKAVAEGLDDDSVALTVRAQRQKLQTEYEQMVAMGARVKEAALANLKAMGVTLFPEDRVRLAAAQAANNQMIGFVQSRVRAEADAVRTNLRAYQEDLNGFLQMLNLKVAAEKKADAEIAAARMAGLAGTARAQVGANLGSSASGAYSSLAAASFGRVIDPEALRVQEEAKNKARALSDAQRELAERSRDVHSAFRGIAGAGGALFLTYGSLLPLTAAFFATSAVRDSIQQYKDLEYQLKFVQAVADDTSVSLDKMMSSVYTSAKAIGASPVEAAQGLRILAQAGLNSQDALNALPDILRLSTVGEIDMAHAAEVATGAVNAFGLGVGNIGRVVDVFYKSAAVSNTSVKAISESMKQASTIAERYKLSVEDVGVALVALAKRNITGSAAGTALTQMFNELATPKGQGKKIASQLGITLFDPIKQDAKDFFEKFVPELREKLKQFDPASQTFILNELTNNRGAKALSAILGLSDEELADLKSRLNDATGAAARAVTELNDSVQGDLNKLKVSFQEALGDAGAAGSDQLRAALQNLRQVVESDDFHTALAMLVGGVADLLQLVTWVGQKWLEWDKFRKSLPWFIDPLSKIHQLVMDSQELMGSKDKNQAAIDNIENTIRKEREFQDSLDDSIKKLREKLGLQGQVNTSSAVDIAQQVTAQQAKVDDALAKLQGAGNGAGGLGLIGAAGRMAERQQAQQEYDQAVQGLNKLLDLQQKMNEAAGVTQMKRSTLASLQDQEAKRNAQGNGSGTRHFNLNDPGAANSAYNELRRQESLAAAARKQAIADEEEDERHREVMLKASYDRGVIDYGSYQSQLEQLQQQASQRRHEELQTELDALNATGPKLQAAFASAQAAGSKASIQKAANDLEIFRQKVAALQLELKKLDNKDAERLAANLTKALKPAADIVRNADKELSLERQSVQAELQKLAVKNNGAALSEKEAYVQAEVLRITREQVETIAKWKAALKQMLDSGAFAEGDDGMPRPEAIEAWNRITAAIDKAQKQLDDTKSRVSEAASAAFDDKKVQDFANSLNRTLVDQLTSAGHHGGREMRDAIEEELIRKPLRVVLQAILQPVSNGIAQVVMGRSGLNLAGLGGGGGGGGVGSIVNYANLLGGGSLGNTIGTMYANATGTGIDGLLATNGAYGTAGAGIMGTVGAALPYVGALYAASQGQYGAAAGMAIGTAIMPGIGTIVGYIIGSLVDGKHGGPKQDSTSQYYAGGLGLGDHPAGADKAANAGAAAVQAQYDALVKEYGGVGGLNFGIGTSTDPKGTSPSFADVTLIRGTDKNSKVANFANYKIGRSSEELQKAVAELTNRAMLRGLQEAHLDGILGDYLKALGDVAKLSADRVTDAINKITKASTEKATLDETWFQLTHTAEENLQHQRQKELDALDDSNKAMAYRIYALQDELAKQEKAKQALAEYNDLMDGVRKNIGSFLDRLNATPAGMLTPAEQLSNAKSQFEHQLTLARGGDRSALEGITSYADQLIQAQGAYTASGSDTASLIAYVKGQLAQLPDQVTAAEYVANAVGDGADLVNASIQDLINRADANAAAQIAAVNAAAQTEIAALTASVTQEAAAYDAAVQAQNNHLRDVLNLFNQPSQYDDATAGSRVPGVSPTPSTGGLPASQVDSSGGVIRWTDQFGHFAAGGDHFGGLRLVGELGPELEATGPARIYSAQQTRALLGSADPALLQAVADLTAQVADLQQEVRGLRVVVAAGARGQIDATNRVVDNTAETARASRRAFSAAPVGAVK